MIQLQKFRKADIPRLINWITDARFLLQWAGPQYKYPLDETQVLATFENTKGEKLSYLMFKAILMPQKIVVGHVELMNIDYEKKTTRIGRVLIGEPTARGKGYGKAMVSQAIDYAFNKIGLDEISLGVFDFNQSAIHCYSQLGFRECEFQKNARQFEHESWNLIVMKLKKQIKPLSSEGERIQYHLKMTKEYNKMSFRGALRREISH